MPKEVILVNKLPEHRISTLLYFNYNQTWDDMVHYSPFYMIQWSGYKPTWNRSTKENIFVKFKKCMNWYFENGYIIDFDETKYSNSTFQSSLLNREKIYPSKDFAIIYDFEVEIINNYQSSYKPLNKSVLLLLLSYIRAFTWVRSNEISGHSEKSKKSKPEIFHSQFKIISKYIGISPVMVSKATVVLEQMGLIKTYRMLKYKDSDGIWHNEDIIYICPYRYVLRENRIFKCTDTEYDYEKELDYGITFLRERNYVSKKFFQD